MNFYPHHIGDFNSATRHLTRVERSVYRDAIELYYDTEAALTLDIDRLHRKLLCHSDEEKTALKAVLDEFFVKTAGGYAHERCDSEIAKYRSNTRAKARAGIASAAKRKQNSTHVERVSHGCATNQEPVTKNQELSSLRSDSLSADYAAEGEFSNSPVSVDGKKIETLELNRVPFQKIVDLYHEKLPELPRCLKLTNQRKGYIRQRWAEDFTELADWEKYFTLVRGSPFLMGLSVPRNGRRPFRATLDWLCRPEICVKIVEGKYG